MKNHMVFFKIYSLLLTYVFFSGCSPTENTTPRNEFFIIGYYAGNAENIDAYPVEKLTHIIYSFCHLQGNRLAVDNADDSLTIRKLVSLKSRNPQLKVMLSLGGWGGCKTCSEVFNTPDGIKEFAQSVKDLTATYQTDGLDLDWEYPAIEGYPGHQFLPEDKENFTSLVKEIRQVMGKNFVLTFAGGGFTKFLEESIEWEKVMPDLDLVNVMSYDLTSGYSPVTGHHTPLYSTPEQLESTDRAVRFLDSIGVPANKIIIGAAMYARIWEGVDSLNNGLHRPGKFKKGVPFKKFESEISESQGFTNFWDSTAQAPYRYHFQEKLFATFDDPASVRLKTQYALDKKLGGIMFWQLAEDLPEGGLLDVMYEVKNGR